MPFKAERSYLVDKLHSCIEPNVALVADLAHSVEHPPLLWLDLPEGRRLRFALNKRQMRVSDKVVESMRAAIAARPINSRRGLASDWLNWIAFCLLKDAQVLPCEPQDAAAFLDMLIDAGRSKATVEHHMWMLSEVSHRHRFASPFATEEGEIYRDKVHHLPPPSPFTSSTSSGLSFNATKVLATALSMKSPSRRCPAPSDGSEQRRKLRDVAMVHLAYDLFARPHSLVALRWEHISRPKGSKLPKVKHWLKDGRGRHHSMPIRQETFDALGRWRAEAGPSPFIFHRVLPHRADCEPEHISTDQEVGEREAWPHLTDRYVTDVLRKAAKLAGLGNLRLTGRSPLIGAFHDMVQAGYSDAIAINLCGWRVRQAYSRSLRRAVAKRRDLSGEE
ncbi:hypothetical protein [Rhodanobacter sp. DHG33]|uniref:hypothetical protein n=1 Tax=Rhodanobacter sp. DHG33 TaxID=2775921 RepID=UPI00178779DE|nr:hypothetical protein [Rhodanobacter sp. DHG33]MBD8898548.1 hypothetical protein [Rhodanobacter sp. DHG33]